MGEQPTTKTNNNEKKKRKKLKLLILLVWSGASLVRSVKLHYYCIKRNLILCFKKFL